MGGKVSRFLRNYDAERRALNVLGRQEKSAEPARAPRFTAEMEHQRRVAADPELEAAVNQKNPQLLNYLTKVKVVSSGAAPAQLAGRTQADRPLPQRRQYAPTGDLGVPDVPLETVPLGRLTLQQFQELLNTREPVGKLPSAVVQDLLEFYAPLVQRSQDELRQMVRKAPAGAAENANPAPKGDPMAFR